MCTEIVTIHVGPKRKAFVVHKELICSRSDYFDKAFNGRFIEADGVMYLPYDDPTIFGYLVSYLYGNVLPPNPADAASEYEDDGEDNDLSWVVATYFSETLVVLFCLANKLCMNDLANRFMDSVQDLQHDNRDLPCTPRIRKIYNNTPAGSKVREYCALTAVDNATTRSKTI